MRVIDGYLSRQVQVFWPDAIVYRESDLEPGERERVLTWIHNVMAWLKDRMEDPAKEPESDITIVGYHLMQDLDVHDQGQSVSYVLERLDEDPIGLGSTFKEAKQAVAALKRQEEMRNDDPDEEGGDSVQR